MNGTSEIAYAFKYDPEACFDRHTGRLAMPNGKGLTCVTYVLVIFKAAKLPIIDFDGWPERAEDAQVHERLVEWLERDQRVSRDHIAELKMEVRCVRARPEEAGGACLCMGLDDPAPKYVDACAAGLVVIAALQSQPTL